MRDAGAAWIFGYGSLLSRPRAVVRPSMDGEAPCALHGHRRRWDVAMDNRRTIPGYKVYLDAATGAQPPVYVTFLDIAPDADAWVNGLVFPVDAAMLPSLDRRERNYERRDVTDSLDADVGARVWAYFGREDARRRYEAGMASGTAVISRAYHDNVLRDFASFGPAMLEAFHATTTEPAVPLRDLRRVPLPDATDAGRRSDRRGARAGAARHIDLRGPAQGEPVAIAAPSDRTSFPRGE